MAGFFAFRHFHFQHKDRERSYWKLETVPSSGSRYSIISDRAAFVHKSFLPLVSPTAESGPCTDVSLSLQVTSVTGKPPMQVMTTSKELRSSGAVRQYRRLVEREKLQDSRVCFKSLIERFGLKDLPFEELKYTSE